MKKIVFFVTGLDSGGLENYLLRFLQYKASEFSEVFVFCKGGKGGQLEEEYLKIQNLKIVKQKVSFFNILDYLKIQKFIKKNEIDVVCDFTGNFAGLVLFVAKLSKVKNRVVFYRGASDHFNQSFFKMRYNNFVRNLTYKYATSILSNSQAAFDYFYQDKIQDDRFEVIYNGIDSSKFEVGQENLRGQLGIPENAFVIGHTGRFNEAKNHAVILKVAENLVNKYQDIYFILCGNGVKKNLQNIVDEKNINKNVLLFENRNDIPIFLNTMNVFFFPSITEGQPNALIEAMLMGLPFVTSDIASIKETVQEESNYTLCKPNDAEGFSLVIEQYYNQNIQRNERLKKNTAEKFNFKIRFNQFYDKLYENR